MYNIICTFVKRKTMKTEIYLQEQITAIKSFYQSGKDE